MQVVSAREYQAHLDTQAYRTIRVPAVRGKILDREGRVLAENRPRYNLSLYLDDLRKQFAAAIKQQVAPGYWRTQRGRHRRPGKAAAPHPDQDGTKTIRASDGAN